MREKIKIMLILVLMPWIITGITLLVVHYGDAIDLFFERILKTLLL